MKKVKKVWFTFKYLVILYCVMLAVMGLISSWRDTKWKEKYWWND
jgi:hypothetical protein